MTDETDAAITAAASMMARRGASLRRQCGTCGLTAAPGPMVIHLRNSDHPNAGVIVLPTPPKGGPR